MALFRNIAEKRRRLSLLRFLLAAWFAISCSAAQAIDVFGLITEDTSWLDTSEPYRVISHTEVRPNVTLTIGPGVTVIGVAEPASLQVFGTLDIQGEESARTVVQDVLILPGTTVLPRTFQLNIDNAVIEGGGILPPYTWQAYGSLQLTNSTLIGTDPVVIDFPEREALIEGNVFENAGGIVTGTDRADVIIRGNRFSDWQGIYPAIVNLGNGYVCDIECIPSATIVEQNDFLSTHLLALEVGSGSNIDLVAKNNWWGTVDENVIQAMIRDNNDHPVLPSVIYLPFAEQPFTLPKFADVPEEHWAYSFVETLAESGITAGCGGGNYCPEDVVTRAQMAVFLERGMKGSDYGPPAASGNVFLDVGAGDFAASFIEQLFQDGITAGCGGNNFCPGEYVTRAQMAVFLLRAKHGSAYSPPAATGIFGDVPPGSFADGWIEQLAAEGVTSGCGNGNFCPEDLVTRAQMAIFLVRAFAL